MTASSNQRPARLHTALALLLVLGLCWRCVPADTGPRNIEVLFLGHDSKHHDSETYAPLLASALAKDGINVTYTSDPADLNRETLAPYDALLLYANHDSITASQEKALFDFVESGKGFLPIHCASYCFRNSDAFVALVGAQFKEHGTGTFTADIIEADHPVMQGLEPFETWDETYVHTLHNDDRTLLMERVEGDHREPWTWTRTHGDGRIFYTAYGHDERTWSHPGFHTLVKNGLLWAVGDDLRARWEGLSFEPHVYTDHDSIPNYEERDPPPRLQQAFSPEASQQFIQVPPGFELQLFAAEPDIVNPIAMAWDHRGRLWVIETTDYPNDMQPEDEGNDVIKIVEDTDDDGKADSFTIFADNLSIPTSLTFANDGVIVAQAPHFLFLKDTDGDDRADIREVLMTGWGTGDTHAGPSNLKYGLDNWLWGTVGYSNFEGVVGGDSVTLHQGVYRFTPDGQRLERITTFTNNTWGLGFSETFDIFGSTANNEHSVFVAIPDRYYDGVPGLTGDGKVKIDGHYAFHPITQNFRQVDVWGGFTAAAGHNLYTARQFPKEYWNRIALVNEPTGHLLHNAILEPDGSGFREKDGWNLLASADEWVSPVHAEVGPDGAVWILDWYNFIVQHNPTPDGYTTGKGNAHVNTLRDKQHGRIYRLAYKKSWHTMPTLRKDRPDLLVAALEHDNMFWRTTAQRLLVERGEPDVLPDLYEIVENEDVDEIGLNSPAVHALWILHGLGALDGANEDALKVAEAALQHPAAGVRKTALYVLPRTEAALAMMQEAGALDDADLNTRLAAFLTASEMPVSDAIGAVLYEQSKRPEVIEDAWLPEALVIAATRHRAGFLDAYAADLGATAFTTLTARLTQGDTAEQTNWSGLNLDDADWKTMTLPMPWVQTDDLASFDGVVWFRTEVDVPAEAAGRPATLGLSGVYDSDITYLNGTLVGASMDKYDQPRVYEVPAGILQEGRNVIAVRDEDPRGRGGFWGEPEQLYLAAGSFRASLAKPWKYNVEEEYVGGKRADLKTRTPLAQQFLRHHFGDLMPETTTSETIIIPDDEPALEVALSVVVGQLQFDQTTFTVQAGQRVRLTFTNPDDMQHNVLIIQPGTTETVGTLADALATNPNAAGQHYVPDTPAVLFATELVDPRAATTLTFTAPAEPGDYPFVCTFPGHWRTMQGVMRVVAR